MRKIYTNSIISYGKLLVLALVAGYCPSVFAQEDDPMIVERIKVIDRSLPIFNIYVDEDDVKWIANSKTVYRVTAKDMAEPADLAPGEQSLLQLPGGNSDVRWQRDEMKQLLGDAKITTAAYEKKDKVLWIGTDGYGVFKVSVEGKLRLLEEIYVGNSKLRSDFINSIYLSPKGKLWIATEDGAIVRQNGNWDHMQRYFNIQRIEGDRTQTWAIGDDLVWIIDDKNNWTPIEINMREIEGYMHDIAVDREDRIWIASNIMTSYNIQSGRYQHFGPGQYFTSQFVNFVSIDDDGTVWVGTDDKGVYIIIKESTINLTVSLDQPLACSGGAEDAVASVRAVGGTPPYTFTWSSGAISDRADNLGAGLHTVTVTDTEGSSKTAEVEVFNPFITVVPTLDQEESDEGASDAIVTIDVDGGVPGYNAVWSNGATGAQVTGLTEGMYSVTVTDQAGCTADAEIEVTRKVFPLAVQIEQVDPILCSDGSEGAIMARVDGGVKPYSFKWNSRDETVQALTNLGAGQYSVVVSDAQGNTAQASFDFLAPAPVTVKVNIDQSATTMSAEGAATLNVAGGTPPYTFAWPGGGSAASATGLLGGEYAVTVTDANGCTNITSVVIPEDILPLTVEIIEESPVKCPDSQTGVVRAQVQGGKGPFTYQWSTGQQAQALLEGVPAGQIAVTVTDAVGTSVNSSHILKAPEQVSILLTALREASTGQSDGSATAEASGGTAPYTYQWGNGNTSDQVDNLGPGKHIVTVTDANGCTATGTLSISEDILPLSVSLAVHQDVLCAGSSDGSAVVNVTGGKGPFTFAWSTGGTFEERHNDLQAGQLSVTVTDVTGTTASSSIVIEEPEQLSLQVEAVRPASTGGSDGAARVAVSGGLEPFAYQWSTGTLTAEATALTPGEHTVTVTDANGCTASGVVRISEDILELEVALGLKSDILCAGGTGGSVVADVAGGKGPFTYRWSTGSEAAETLEGLAAGEVSVTVTDAVGNEVTTSIFVDEPKELTAEVIAIAPASTNGSDGQAKVVASGGTEPFAYAWSSGGAEAQLANLRAGEHLVTVTDANGCSTTASLTVVENILPLSLTLIEKSPVKCAGMADGVAELEIGGGKGPFDILWSTGLNVTRTATNLRAGTVSVTVTDATGTSAETSLEMNEPEPISASATMLVPATTDKQDAEASVTATGGTAPYTYLWETGIEAQKAAGLAPGVQRVTVTDANGCQLHTQVTITEDIQPLSASIRQMAEIKCSGEATASISVELVGGKGPFDYRWNDPEMDVESLDGLQTGVSVSGVPAGSYTVTVTDALGQTGTAHISIEEPDALLLSVDVEESASTGQSDGKARLTITGGTTPYSIEWDNGETSELATALAPGNHSVTVIDGNGCSEFITTTVSENILPLSLSLAADKTQMACQGDSDAEITIDRNGGKGPFTFTWNDGITSQSADVARSGLGAGDYSLTVTDALGTTAEASLTIAEPKALTLAPVVISSATTDAEDGQAEVDISGGTAPFTFQWDNGETARQAVALAPGDRSVTVTDANGCTAVGRVSITEEILELAVDIQQASPISCAGENDGVAQARVKGGKRPFTYSWSDNSDSQEITALAPGTLSVTVTDAVGQTATASTTFDEPAPIAVEVTDIRAAAAEHVPDGKASVKASGGAGGYTFKWDNGDIGQRATDLGIGGHSVTVTDANGCSMSANFEISKRIIPALTAEALRSGSAVRMEKLQFDADSSSINQESQPALQELYEFLYDNPTLVVEIGGHTNGLPEHDYCDSLSTARAKAVAQYIVGLGIEPNRVYYKGYGKRDPIATNQTAEGRRRNQRVEVKMLELTPSE